MSNLIGKSLGHYHIIEQLGEDGMATVYKAYDPRLKTEVAVKVIRSDSILPRSFEHTVKRFDRKAQVLAKLTHSNIVKILDYGEYNGSPFFVMPYLPGGTLKQLLRGKPIPWQEAVRMLIPIGRALDFTHRQGVIHRDVKPTNILITAVGDPMLMDFGIAKVLNHDETLELTGTNAAVGTPDYMAPEQSTSKNIDHRVDIYSLGLVLYEMVAGRKPFIADTPMAVIIKNASDPLPRPSQFVSTIPDGLEKILLKMLVKTPGQRYQTMGDAVSALEGMLSTNQLGSKLHNTSAKNVSTLPEKPGDMKWTQTMGWGLFILVGLTIIGALTGLLVNEIQKIKTNSAEAPEAINGAGSPLY